MKDIVQRSVYDNTFYHKLIDCCVVSLLQISQSGYLLQVSLWPFRQKTIVLDWHFQSRTISFELAWKGSTELRVTRALFTDKREKSKLLTEIAMEAQVITSVAYEQQLNSKSLMRELQNGEALVSTECNLECPRWSSLDSDIPASEELSGCELPASNAALNTTFAVEIDSVGSYTSPSGLLDSKTGLKITRDLDEPAGMQKCNTNCNDNETFIFLGSKNDCISIPGVHCFAGSSAKAVSSSSLYSELSSDNEAEYRGGRSSDRKDADVKRKVADCKSYMLSDFQMADDELDGSSFKLEDDGVVGASAMHVTSTPLASHVANSVDDQLDTELTVKPARRVSSPAEHEFPQSVPRARRMLQMREVDNTMKEGVARNRTDETCQNPDVNVLDVSFTVSPVEKCNDQVLLDASSPKHDQTYIVSKLENSAAGGLGRNLSHFGHLTPVRYRDCKTLKYRLLSSKNHRNSYVQHQSAHEGSSFGMNNDMSLSNTNVFEKDGDIASFFVTEFPSMLTGECHDFLRSAFNRQSISTAQTEDLSSPCQTRIVVTSAESTPDLFTDWSFSSLLEQACSSFDDGSVNELDDAALRQHSSTRRLSNVTRLPGLDEETQQLNCASKCSLTYCH